MQGPENAPARKSRLTLVVLTGHFLLPALVLGALLWVPMIFFLPTEARLGERSGLLLVVLGNQVGCLIVGLARRRMPSVPASSRLAFLAGVAGVLVAVSLGIAYDQFLRVFFAADAPTIGPWGAVRAMPILICCSIVFFGVAVSPAADEFFFRNGVFRIWRDAGYSGEGALVSSILFALSRLEFVNIPAYVGLGILLCAIYYWTGSLLAPWITHTLLNAAMFLLLFSGYQ